MSQMRSSTSGNSRFEYALTIELSDIPYEGIQEFITRLQESIYKERGDIIVAPIVRFEKDYRSRYRAQIQVVLKISVNSLRSLENALWQEKFVKSINFDDDPAAVAKIRKFDQSGSAPGSLPGDPITGSSGEDDPDGY